VMVTVDGRRCSNGAGRGQLDGVEALGGCATALASERVRGEQDPLARAATVAQQPWWWTCREEVGLSDGWLVHGVLRGSP
jgi:hypothetical protein